MEFEGFDWDPGNIAKRQKHGISLVEIESVFRAPVLILNGKAHAELVRRFWATGTTATGRKAFIAFAMRGGRVRPISARFMRAKEIERYEKDHPGA